MRKLDYERIVEILKYATLTCTQISEITGQSLYASKQMRLKIIEDYKGKYRYTTGSHIRTDHFVQWYDSPVLNKAYKDLYMLICTNNQLTLKPARTLRKSNLSKLNLN